MLTDIKIRRIKPNVKTSRYFDGGGLYIEVPSSGNKRWRFKYRFKGKEKRISFGVYPNVTLKEARIKRDEAKRLLANGIDPSEHRKTKKTFLYEGSEDSFERIAREWFSKKSSEWSEGHARNLIQRLEKEIFPWLGKTPISSITSSDLLSILRRIEERGAIETARRLLQCCRKIFKYGVATASLQKDPSFGLEEALQPVKHGHFSSITDPKGVAELLRSIDGYKGHFIVKCALKLFPLLFPRPGELRKAEWLEIDFEKQEWNIPAQKMKMRVPHLVPLPKQALEILEDLYPLTGRGRFVFPSLRSRERPMSDNAILSALRRMGYTKDEMTAHGFRAMARTLMDEQLNIRPDFIEHQLAHAVRDPNGRAYNRTSHLEERRKMMQQWANYLDELKGHPKHLKISPLNEHSVQNEVGFLSK